MHKALLVLGLFACSAALAPAIARATPSDDLQYLVGSWSCTATGGGASLTEDQNVVAIPGWIYGTGTVTSNGQIVGSTSFYVGYDARNDRFVLVSIGSTGNYDIVTSNSPHLNGSTWTAAYPASPGSSVFTEDAPSQYTIASAMTSSGQTRTSRQICTRHKT